MSKQSEKLNTLKYEIDSSVDCATILIMFILFIGSYTYMYKLYIDNMDLILQYNTAKIVYTGLCILILSFEYMIFNCLYLNEVSPYGTNIYWIQKLFEWVGYIIYGFCNTIWTGICIILVFFYYLLKTCNRTCKIYK